jgi:hypothetical protein
MAARDRRIAHASDNAMIHVQSVCLFMKLNRTFIRLATIGGLAALASVHAQSNGGKSPMPVRASVGDVTDNRSTGSFFSECKVELKFTGDAAADAGTVRQVRVLIATDELGRDLKPDKDDGMSASSFSSSRSSGALKTEVKLKNPSRNATVIKTLQGEVELFSPTEANGAILHVKDVLKHPAEPIQNPALAKYGIQLMYLTKETYEAKKKELEAQQSNAAGQKLGEAVGEMFKGMFGNMMSDSKESIALYVKDPDKRIVGLEFQDATGKPLKSQGSWSSSDFKQTQLAGPPAADTQLVIQLAVPEAVKTFPFEIHDIALP